MSYCIYWNNWNDWLLRRIHSFSLEEHTLKRTLKLGFYIWKFGNGIFSKSVYASFKLITKTNKWYPKKYFKHGGHGWKFGKKYVQKLRTSKFSRLQGALIRKKSVFRFLSYLQATSMFSTITLFFLQEQFCKSTRLNLLKFGVKLRII